MKSYALLISVGMLIATAAVAADTGDAPAACKEVQACGAPDCCGHCGCHACCEKYCRVVCEMKEIKKIVWAVKCEDFCAPLPRCGHCCGDGCESCCEEADCNGSCDKCCNPCASLENRNYVAPKCGKVRTKKTLEKKEITCKIPTYKCVVVYACAGCGSKCGGEKAEPQTLAAPLPAPAPKTTQSALHQPLVSTSYLR